MINKKGQEEMVGFVLVVVIVAIIFLVFLLFFLRSDGNIEQESSEAFQFITAMNRYTSECAINFEPDYSTIDELKRDCYEGKRCTSGKNACSVLEETTKEILESSFIVNEESFYKGYRFSIIYDDNSSVEDVLEINKGNCSAGFVGAESISAGFSGVFVTDLKICS